MKARFAWFAPGLLLLIGAELLRDYLIMPFPGSQRANTIALAYFLNRSIWAIRIVGLIAIFPALWSGLVRGSVWARIGLVVAVLVYGAVFYFTNFMVVAEKMFRQPRHLVLAGAEENAVSLDRLVIGIAANGDARAYPIEFIGHHHQVQDTLGGRPVLVTYCTVCRTGRVYDPVVDGRHERFRLVGMDHFNAMFEDGSTKSWWRQVTGEAIAGPRKGRRLGEIPSEQMTLRAWLDRHPQSRVLQPDPDFVKDYQDLRGFDDGTRGGALTGRRRESWTEKSWVVGVVAGPRARAYDWNDLRRLGTINDRIGDQPVVIWMSPDGKSFAVRSRVLDGRDLTFARHAATGALEDSETRSRWDEDGVCLTGSLEGARLAVMPGYQEFWHSWRSFHPGTDAYRP